MRQLVSMGFVALITMPSAGYAQGYPPTYREPDGRTWTCLAPHLVTGQYVPVAGINGYAHGFWGLATHNGSGWPVIIFDVAQLQHLPPILVRFVYYHECAHHTERTDRKSTRLNSSH